jgi:hypothetical protein
MNHPTPGDPDISQSSTEEVCPMQAAAHVTFDAFDNLYQGTVPDDEKQDLRSTLAMSIQAWNPHGWFIHECKLMDSTHMGERTVVVYGDRCTIKAPPVQPFSLRGLASDTGVVVAILTRDQFELEQEHIR